MPNKKYTLEMNFFVSFVFLESKRCKYLEKIAIKQR